MTPKTPHSGNSTQRYLHGWVTLAVLAFAIAGVQLAAARDDVPAMQRSLPVVQSLDIERYAGRWYEIARLPNSFQRKCVADVTADYVVEADGNLSVRNTCLRRDGEVDVAVGEARRTRNAPSPDAGMLEVRFAPRWLSWLAAVWGDYYVMAIDPDYRLALIGTPDREYLWLLSRSPSVADDTVQLWLGKAAALGFPVERVARTAHSAIPQPSTESPTGPSYRIVP